MSAPMACRPATWMLTGRAPIAQPPGRETSARPKRASSGPSTKIDARMVFTSWYGAKYSLIVEASTSMRIFSSIVTETPMRPSSSIMVVTSCKCGTLDTVTGPSASRHPARMGRVAFFAPEIRISPSSAMPPLICNLSTSLRSELLRRKHLQRQRVNLIAHGFPQGAVHHLMALHGSLAGEFRCNHHGLEMHVVVALDERLAAGQAAFDDFRYLLLVHARSCKNDKLTRYNS